MKKALELHSIEVFALWAFYGIGREKRVVSPLMAFMRAQFSSTIDAFYGLSEGQLVRFFLTAIHVTNELTPLVI